MPASSSRPRPRGSSPSGFAQLRRARGPQPGAKRLPRRRRVQAGSVGEPSTSASRPGRLSEERQQRLEAVPGWVWDAKEAAWEDGYDPPAALRRARGPQPGPSMATETRTGSGWVRWVERSTSDSKTRPTLRRATAATGSPAGLGLGRVRGRLGGRLSPACCASPSARATAGCRRATETTTGSGWVAGSPINEVRRSRPALRGATSGDWKPCRVGSGTRSKPPGRTATPDCGRSPSARATAGCRRATETRTGSGWVSGSTSTERRGRGRLSEERQRRLEALPGWVWDTHEAAWEEGYARLRAFAEREGHSRVPSDYRDDDGFRLGQWVGNQRTARAAASSPRSDSGDWKLCRAGSGTRYEADWEDGYARLHAVRRARGPQPGASMPTATRTGSGWVSGSAVNGLFSVAGELSEERQRRLEAVPGWVWDTRTA